MIACEVIFKGRVQGVGFRYTARDMARDLGLTGWVKNLPDGGVQLMAEGEALIVDDLIGKLETHFMVREKSIVRSGAVRGWTDFTIQY